MSDLASVLRAGLEAMDYRLTASRGDWTRMGKFGRGAYYILRDGSMWYSPLHQFYPQVEVTGPFLDNVFDAGCAAQETRPARLNSDQLLEELGKEGSNAS